MEFFRSRVRSTKLLHFISSHPFDLICIQKSNLNLCPCFQITGFSALRSDCSHSRFDIFSTDVTHPSGGIIIFVRQGLSYSELCTARSLAIFCFSTTSGPGPWELSGFWVPWSPAMPPSFGRSQVTTTARLKLPDALLRDKRSSQI